MESNSEKDKNNDIFDKAVERRGGRVKNPNTYDKNVIEFMDTLLDQYKNNSYLVKPFPTIIFNIVENPSINAFAMAYRDKYIIGINSGSIHIIYDLFHRMLSHREILPNVGDINEEIVVKPTVNDYYRNVNDMIRDEYSREYKLITPLNKTRRKYANHLAWIAITFLFEHELSHIINGHIDYLKEKNGINIFSEYHSIDELKQSNFDLQTLEMDADSTALTRCCNYGINAVNKRGLHPLHPSFEFYTDYYQVLGDISFAVHNIINLFDDSNYKNSNIGTSSHPEPIIRQIMQMGLMISLNNLPQFSKIDMTKLRSIIIQAIPIGNKAYELTTGKIQNEETYEEKYILDHPLPMAMLDNWKNNIRSKLIKHTFMPLAP